MGIILRVIIYVLYRFLSGHHMSRHPRSNYGFFHRATRIHEHTRWSTRWGRMSMLERASLRVILVTGGAGCFYFWNHYRTPIVASLIGLGALLFVALTWKSARTVRTWHHARVTHHPLSKAIAPLLGLSVPDASDAIHLRNGYASVTAGSIGHIDLPPGFKAASEERRAVEHLVSSRLTSQVEYRWALTQRPMQLKLSVAPAPPDKVTLDDIRAAALAAPDAAPIMGIGSRGAVISVNLATDLPHLAASCSTGSGKSVLLRGMIAQWLRNGVQVVILDGKRVSQSWCKDLPGVTYCRTGAEMHETLVNLAAEADRRYSLIDSVPAEDEDSVDVGPRVVVVFEEQNIGMQFLAEYWTQTRTSDDPKRSPAIRALDYLLMAGRQAQLHVVSIAQMFTVQACGGNPAARENYGGRIMANATRNAWLMLAPECGPPFPKSGRKKGRMHLVIDGEATAVQVTFWTIEQARTWATGGAVTVPAGWVSPSPTPGTPVAGPAETPRDRDTQPTSWVVGLDAGAIQVGLGVEAFKKRRQRSGGTLPGEVRRGVQPAWKASDLDAWKATWTTQPAG